MVQGVGLVEVGEGVTRVLSTDFVDYLVQLEDYLSDLDGCKAEST